MDSRVEKFLNCSIAIVACTALLSLGWDVGARIVSHRAHPLSLGDKLTVKGFSWRTSSTVVVFASTTCPYTAASLPLYRDINYSIEKAGAVVDTVLLFRAQDKAWQAFSRAFGLTGYTRVSYEDFERLGITATPTVVLVSAQGTVEKVWRGQLSARQQRNLFSSLRLNRSYDPRTLPNPVLSGHSPDYILNAAAVAAKLQDPVRPLILDVREREAFALSHIRDSVNIPTAELELRTQHEIPQGRTVLVFANSRAQCEAVSARDAVLTECSFVRMMLLELGYKSVLMIGSDQDALESAGVSVVHISPQG